MVDIIDVLYAISIAFAILGIIVIVDAVYGEEIETFKDCIESGIVPEICDAMFPLNIQRASANITGGIPFP